MKCPFCGELLEDDSLFCTSCGSRLDSDDDGTETLSADTVRLDEHPDDGADNDAASYDDVETSVLSDEENDAEENFPGSEEEITDESEIFVFAEEEYPAAGTALLDENEMPESDQNDYSDESDMSAAAGDEFSFAEDHVTEEDSLPENAEEETASGTAQDGEAEEPQPEESGDAPAPASASPVSGAAAGNGKLSLAVLMLSVALLAIIGYLFIDKLMTFRAASSPATTIRIISQTENISVKPDTHTEFYVDASGTNLSYQWYVRKNGEQMWHVWKNHNDPKTVADANESWDGMQVYCMITDNNRTSVASDVITISIEK